jgi:ubiquinone/menaquinone biosynthesis C-methylase UbiE
MPDDFYNPPWRQLYGAVYSRPSDSKIFGTLEYDFTAARAYIDARTSDGLRLTPTHLVIAALGRTIAADVPEINCVLQRGRAVPHDGVHVAVAVSIPDARGTTTILVRDANRKSLEEIASQVREDATGERDESGGADTRSRQSAGRIPWPFRRLLGRFLTFAVTEFGLELPRVGLRRDSFGSVLLSNIGSFGLDTGMLALLPIARIPVAIAMARIQDKAVVRDGQIVVRPILTLTGTFDHRLLDGALIGRLAGGVRRRLLEPKLLESPAPYEVRSPQPRSRARRPTAWLLRGFHRLERTTPAIRLALWRRFYDYVNTRHPDPAWTFTNYGYAPAGDPCMDLDIGSEEEPDRWAIQLYEHLLVYANLRDRHVLDVGSGRGGGAAYVARRKGVASMTGLDLSTKAVEFARKRHPLPNLTFRQGEAGRLPFDDESFDVVLNVESCHHYPSLKAFLAEVNRVLRTGGLFLLTDFRETSTTMDKLAEMEADLAASPLADLLAFDIREQVVRALELDEENKRETLQRAAIPRWSPMAPISRQLAAVRGSPMYADFLTGRLSYVSHVMCKGEKPDPALYRGPDAVARPGA